MEKIAEFIESTVDELDGGMGSLRRSDITHQIQYMMNAITEREGRPVMADDAYDIATTAIADSYASEIGKSVKWDCVIAVKTAYAILEEANCHTEAAALSDAAASMGIAI